MLPGAFKMTLFSSGLNIHDVDYIRGILCQIKRKNAAVNTKKRTSFVKNVLRLRIVRPVAT
jgi:hypothetical protein